MAGLCLAAFGQAKVDSLKYLLNKKEGKQKFDIYIELSSLYDHENTDSSLYYTLLALEYVEHLNDLNLISSAHRNLGVSYDLAGLYDKALEHYNKSLEFLKKSGNKDEEIKAHIIHDKGMVYQELREYDRAKDMMIEALEIYHKSGDSSDLITSYHSLGSMSWETNNYDSALIYLTTASELVQQNFPEDYDWLCLIESEIIQTYYYLENLEMAEMIYTKLADPEKQSQYSLYSQAYMKFNEGLIESLNGNYEKSLAILSEVLELSDSIGLSEEGINILIEMVRIAEKSSNYKKAYQLSNELLRREREWLNIQKVAYTRAKEIEMKTREKDETILYQEAEISNRNLAILLISILALAVLILSFFIFRNYKKIKAKNQRIDSLIRELHHRVKNNLQVISSLLSLQSMKLEEGEAKMAVEEGRSRIKAMAMIHQKLYLDEDIAEVDTEEYLMQLLQDLSSSFGISEDKLNLKINSTKMDIDTILPVGLIVNELVSNSFKYAFKENQKARLKVNFEVLDNRVHLFIKDNGNGLPKDFDLSKSTSFGLKLVNLLVKQLKGEIQVESNEGLSYDLKFDMKKQAA